MAVDYLLVIPAERVFEWMQESHNKNRFRYLASLNHKNDLLEDSQNRNDSLVYQTEDSQNRNDSIYLYSRRYVKWLGIISPS